MGLSLCYELRLPGATLESRVVELFEKLRTCAIELDIPHVTSLLQLQSGELNWGPLGPECSLETFFSFCAAMVRDGQGETQGASDGSDRVVAIGFAVAPGRGCEAATFGLVPSRLEAPDAAHAAESTSWYWQWCCKTQYASVVSDEHFVRCHVSLVELLDEAVRIGFDVTVHDETGYWESRSTEELLGELQKMNRLLAGFAGALHDAIGSNHRVDAAIFEHPDFERLETDATGSA